MNSSQLIDNAEALRLFFNDDVYLIGDYPTVDHQLKPETVPLKTVNEEITTPQAAPNGYQETLVSIPKVQEPAASYQPAFSFKHLGKNEKNILILVHDTQNPVSTPQGTELLRKLVLSINLKNADFALVNYAAYTDAKFEHLKSFFACKLVLSFGVAPETIGLTAIPLHQLHQEEGIRMIFSHNLHDLDTDIPAKKTLWGTLKNLQ